MDFHVGILTSIQVEKRSLQDKAVRSWMAFSQPYWVFLPVSPGDPDVKNSQY